MNGEFPQPVKASVCTRRLISTSLLLLFTLVARLSLAQTPGLLWTTNVGARIFAVDSQTNVYANAGGIVIKLDGDGQPLQTNSICPVSSPSPIIARRDSAGNFYFAGNFDGTNDFGGVTLVGGWINGVNYNPPRWAPGWPTCFLAKYASNGSLQWAVSFGTQAMSNYLSDAAINSDDSVTVGFMNYNGSRLAQFSATGTNLWQTGDFGGQADFGPVKVGGFVGANGSYLKYGNQSIAGGFYGAAGNRTAFTGFPPLVWVSTLSAAGKPVTDGANGGYVAGKQYQSGIPLLQKSLAGGSIVWTQAIGTVEQWVLAGDSAVNLYLAGTNGIFSKYDREGNLIWSTNYGLPAITMLVDSQLNRFLHFTDNSIARLASDPPPLLPTISMSPQPLTVFVGSNASLTVSATGTAPLRYAWQQNGTNVPNATNAVLSFTSIATSQAGLYTVIVTNIAGSVTSTPPALLRVKSVELYLGSQLLTNGTYVFATAPTLAIHSAFVGGSAFYSLDGSSPSFGSIHYSGPFTVTHSTTVRAIGYSSDFFQSEEADTINVIVLVQHSLTTLTSGGGSVSLNPPGGVYLSTNIVAATATPLAGYSFLYWTGDAIGTNPSVNVSMERDKTIRAVFGTTLSTTIAGNGQIQLYPPGSLYANGSVVRLTAIPDPGNYFGFWGGAVTGNNTNPLYFTITAPTQTVSSIFGPTPGGQAALTFLINGHGRVTANPRANAYTLNQNVTLTAVPDSGENFLGWSGDASGTQNPLSVTMNAAKVITTNFTAKPNLHVEGWFPEGFRLTLLGDPGSVWQLLASTNLATWTSLGSVSNGFGEVQFNDTNSPGSPQRFYKAGP